MLLLIGRFFLNWKIVPLSCDHNIQLHEDSTFIYVWTFGKGIYTIYAGRVHLFILYHRCSMESIRSLKNVHNTLINNQQLSCKKQNSGFYWKSSLCPCNLLHLEFFKSPNKLWVFTFPIFHCAAGDLTYSH